MGSYCLYTCLTCNDGIEYDSKVEFKNHLIAVHGYKERTIGTRRFSYHMDGSGFHETGFEWDYGTFKFLEKNGWQLQIPVAGQ